jgi:hypothetical protein
MPGALDGTEAGGHDVADEQRLAVVDRSRDHYRRNPRR